ncbi:LysR family transcriptional regulator [Saccharopolyspora erythraea NRRL 2338]|uniref:LysR family transcriptional regulator n=1 Tax=Saccharopolyspora erythraea TaxID=1836 RepID=A0ABN1BXD1_SACER|nr:LysR family transcriptional regulator [Saccharopolyspora erythraea NRRL 2338]
MRALRVTLREVDLRRLTSFVAVAEEGHFGRAAARLFLSPAAVTAHVKQLERELGVTLLDRTPVRPTAAGERLLRHARVLIDTANAAAAELADAPSDDLPLRVGIMGHGSAELTPASLQAFRRARPESRLAMTTLDFTEGVSALLERRVDAAFVRPAPIDERIAVDVLTTEQRIVVVPSAWQVADAPGVRLRDVLELPYFSLPDRTPRSFTDYLYFASARGGEQPRRSRDHALTPQDVLINAALGRGAGSALLSFTRYYSWPGTTFVPVTDAPWEHSVLATRADDRRPDVLLLRNIATKLARELGPRLRLSPPSDASTQHGAVPTDAP